MKGVSGNAKLILFQPATTVHKPPNGSSVGSQLLLGAAPRLWLIIFICFLTLASFLALFSGTTATIASRSSTFMSIPSTTPLPNTLFDALLHYASFSNATYRMSESDMHAIASVIRRRAPCNLLVFGLSHETLLWRSLNHGGRTVFLDENEYYIALYDHAKLEAYDVAYTTRVRDFRKLMSTAREQRHTECRPVQNLLFSDCKLAINDLPNNLYDVNWDIILVDGPNEHHPGAPGRMASIFTAGVMARSQKEAGKRVDVLVHDYAGEIEREFSEEFLCNENMVFSNGQLSHFVIQNPKHSTGKEFEFCHNNNNLTLS